MKHLFKLICAMLMLVPAWLSTLATNNGDVVTRLTIVGTNGTETHFNLYDKPELTFDDQNLNIESGSVSASFPRTDLAYFHFTQGSPVVGIDENTFDKTISYTYINNIFIVEGQNLPQISVYDISGIMHLSTVPADNYVQIDMNGLPAGIYIIVIPEYNSVKIIKK